MVSLTDSFDAGVQRPAATRTQHAIRILALLDRCGDPTIDSDPVSAIRAVRSELRLQAMDFWMRNPDYLADEIISQVQSGLIDRSYLAEAGDLLDGGEPDLHWYPMPRWFYGAYEAIDDAVALLETYGLAVFRRTGEIGAKSQRNSLFLTEKGAGAVRELLDDPVLSWYPRQANLVALVAKNTVGSKLKDRQYEQATYAGTELGLEIASIADHVRKRLKALEASANGGINGGAS
jgi:hypothetical protein